MAPLELKIQNWLLQGMTAQNIAQQLQDSHQDWTQRDALVGMHFLYQTGQYKKAARLFAQRMREKRWIPWGIGMRLLVKAFSSTNFRPEWFLAIDKGVKRQNAQDQTWAYRNLDADLDFWVTHRAFFQHSLQEQIVSYKQRLFEQIEYFQSQRLLDHEEKALKKLLTIDPHNPDLAKQWQNFRERWATYILQKKRDPVLHEDPVTKDPKVDKWLNVLIKDIQGCIQQNSSSLLDFVILLMTMEEWDKALGLYANRSVAWTEDLRGEIYLKANRFLELMEWCHKQEELNADEIDHLIVVHYLKAQAFHALGEHQQALDILKDIQALRPHYRSIDSLIFHWTRGQES